MKKQSQSELILKYLEAGNSLTSLEALRLFKCLRLSGRIYDLKKAGYNDIDKVMVKIKNKRVARYYKGFPF